MSEHNRESEAPNEKAEVPQSIESSTTLSDQAESSNDQGASQTTSEAPQNTLVCDACGKEFPSRSSLRGHSRIHAKPPESKVTAQGDEIENLRKQLELKKIEAESAKVEKERAEAQLKKLQAERQISSMRAESSRDPVEAGVERLIRLKELQTLGVGATDAPARNGESDEMRHLREQNQMILARLDRQEQEARTREHDEYLRRSILSDVEKSVEPTNRKLDELNQSLAKTNHSSSSESAIVASINTLDRRLGKMQDNLATLALNLLGSVGGPPPASVQGLTPNSPQLQAELEKLGLVDHSPKQR